MSFNFPNNPIIGQQVVNPTSSAIYTWDGVTWDGTYDSEVSNVLSGSFAKSSSLSPTIGRKIFKDLDFTEFNWFSPVHGNPTSSGAVITGSFITGDNFNGVRLTTGANSNGGVVRWSGSSYINFEEEDIWITFNTKLVKSSTAGIYTIFNGNTNFNGTSIPNTTFANNFAIQIDDNANNIKIYNQNSTPVATVSLIGGIQSDIYTQWDTIVWKGNDGYYMNLYQSYTSTPDTTFGLNKTFPYPIPVNTSNNNIVPIYLGTSLPTGSVFGIAGGQQFLGSNSNKFTNKLQIRSATLAPTFLGPYK